MERESSAPAARRSEPGAKARSPEENRTAAKKVLSFTVERARFRVPISSERPKLTGGRFLPVIVYKFKIKGREA